MGIWQLYKNKPGPAGRPHVRDRAVAFPRVDGLSVLAAEEVGVEVRPAEGGQVLRRPEEIPGVRRRMAARRPGAAVGAQGLRRPADLRVRNRRHDRDSQEPHRDRRLPDRLRIVQSHAAGRVLSQGRELADARPFRPAPAAAGGRAPVPVPRRDLLLHRPGSRDGSSS